MPLNKINSTGGALLSVYGFREGQMITLAKGEKLPSAPDGCEWKLVGAQKTNPVRKQYELVKKAAAEGPGPRGHSDHSSISRAGTPSLPGMSKPRETKDKPHWGDLTTVREGSPLPAAGAGFKWVKTGVVYETSPAQVEYRLEKKKGPSYIEAAELALETKIDEIQSRTTEELRPEDYVRSITIKDGCVVLGVEKDSNQSDTYLPGMCALMRAHLARAGFEKAPVDVRYFESKP